MPGGDIDPATRSPAPAKRLRTRDRCCLAVLLAVLALLNYGCAVRGHAVTASPAPSATDLIILIRAQGASALPAAVDGIAAGRGERLIVMAVVGAGLERGFAQLLHNRIQAEIKATRSDRGGATTYAVARPEVVAAFLRAALVLRENGRIEPQQDLLQFDPVLVGYHPELALLAMRVGCHPRLYSSARFFLEVLKRGHEEPWMAHGLDLTPLGLEGVRVMGCMLATPELAGDIYLVDAIDAALGSAAEGTMSCALPVRVAALACLRSHSAKRAAKAFRLLLETVQSPDAIATLQGLLVKGEPAVRAEAAALLWASGNAELVRERLAAAYATYDACFRQEALSLWEAHLRQVAAPAAKENADSALTPAEAAALQAVLAATGDARARLQAFGNLLAERVPWAAEKTSKSVDQRLRAAGGSEDEMHRIAFALYLLGQR